MAGRRGVKRKAKPVGNGNKPKRTQTSTTATRSTSSATGHTSSATGNTSSSTVVTSPSTGVTSPATRVTSPATRVTSPATGVTSPATGVASPATGATSTSAESITGSSSTIHPITSANMERAQFLRNLEEERRQGRLDNSRTSVAHPFTLAYRPPRIGNEDYGEYVIFRRNQLDRVRSPSTQHIEVPIGSITETGNDTAPSSAIGGDADEIELLDEIEAIKEPGNPIGITPSDCAKLLKTSAATRDRLMVPPNNNGLPFLQLPIALLLDCRAPENFSNKRIDFPNFVSVPSLVFGGDSSQMFTSKAEVFKLLQKECPELLGKLNSPGYYANIILVDETSTTKNITSSSLKIIRLAMIKWNETTKTSIKLLEGGFAEFSMQFPEMIKQLPGLPIQRVAQDNAILNVSSEVTMQNMESPENNVEYVSPIMKTLTNSSQILHSFKCVKQALMLEHESLMLKYLEAQFPDDVKCPVCFKTYNGEIIQCGNGRSMCGTCAEKVDACGGVKVRNRSLENLIANYLKCECTCGESVVCKDAQSHAKMCARNKNKSKETVKIEAEINSKEMEIQKLDESWVLPGSSDQQRKEKHNLFMSMLHKL